MKQEDDEKEWKLFESAAFIFIAVILTIIAFGYLFWLFYHIRKGKVDAVSYLGVYPALAVHMRLIRGGLKRARDDIDARRGFDGVMWGTMIGATIFAVLLWSIWGK